MTDNLCQTPPPALTWTHLFSPQTRFVCLNAPGWFSQQAAEWSGTGVAPLALVGWKESQRLLKAPAAVDGVVAVNCRLDEAAFYRNDFSYVRHYAAVPSLRNARWFVPLDSPQTSQSALSLYTPSRRSAKVKRAIVKAAMHARLPLWYRDQIWIARRTAPPLESALASVVEGDGVRWALSSGAPLGARNRKASALLIDRRGKLLSFVKLARSPIARDIVSREVNVLRRLQQIDSIRQAVPRVLFSQEVDQTLLLATTPLEGDVAPLELGAAHREFLAALRLPLRVRASDASIVERLAPRLQSCCPAPHTLLRIYQALVPRLAEFEVPLTIVHGDFAPWNLRFSQGRIGAFDWEYGELNGLPLIDEIHYSLQCGWLLRGWTVDTALLALHAMASRRPLRLEPDQVEAIAGVYLLDVLARLLGEGYDPAEEVIAWHQRLLEKLVPVNNNRSFVAC